MQKTPGIVLVVLLVALSGCGKKSTGDESQPASDPQQQSAKHQSQASGIQTEEEHQKKSLPADTESGQLKSAAGSQTTLKSGKAASRPFLSKGAAANEEAPGEKAKAPANPIFLKGAPLGGVRFEHSKHVAACESCHHLPRGPKSVSASPETCTSCHTKPPQPGMKTGKQAAFHNPAATAGTCIDCHKKSAGSPTKCMQCHRKENT